MEGRLTSIQKVLGSNPSWIPDFFSVDLFLTLSAKTPLFMYMLCELLVTSSEPDF